MPILGTLLTNLFGGLVTWLATYFTKKVAFGVAAVTAMSTLTLGLYVAMRTAMSALTVSTAGMPDFWVMCLGIGVPPAAPFCLSTYMTMWTACTVYTWQRDLLNLIVKA